MSVQLRQDNAAECNRRARELAHLPETVKHTIVFFGGYVGRRPQGGPQVTETEVNEQGETVPRSSFSVLNSIGQLATKVPGGFEVIQFDPRLLPNDAGQELRGRWAPVLDGVLTRLFGPLNGAVRSGGGMFDPRGALIVYGYSAGGFHAVLLCRTIEQWYGWYNFRRRTVGSLQYRTPADEREGSSVRVDLLVTVDACIQRIDPGEAVPFRTPLPVVRRHRNFYQPSGQFHGRRIRTDGVDVPMTGRHEDMPRISQSQVEREILNTLYGQ